jgi:hypothetical protein
MEMILSSEMSAHIRATGSYLPEFDNLRLQIYSKQNRNYIKSIFYKTAFTASGYVSWLRVDENNRVRELL